ncbi:hypothetical protein [Chitinophaga tropicalis]|uniref:Uncharacterized protein n=1 Tax=Chitinophaga tropicalis TaxID=2683588 RepID=A0A7K1U009_9BACT|nr:hypothetical protein [Chitinophaga tropicalis]MVT07683.1 hypothetical protein [Chitinophaga tropicalis]
MSNDLLPFQLYLGGYEISDSAERRHFYELHHFPTLASALTALLTIDPQSYNEPVAQRNKASHFYEAAQITAPGADVALLQIMSLSFDDVPEAAPPAGIYLIHSDELDMRTLMGLGPFTFNEFSYYDPKGALVLLAPMTYENKLIIAPDPALKSLQKKLPQDPPFELQVLRQGLYNQDGQRYPDRMYREVFHFESITAAMVHLVQQDFRATNEDVAGQHVLNNMIREMNLALSTGERLASVAMFADESAKDDNGIYIIFHKDTRELQALTGMDPTINLKSEDSSPYFKLFHFTNEGHDIYPDRNFYQLAQNFLGDRMEETLQKYARRHPCLLITELRVAAPGDQQIAPFISEQQYPFFEQAVREIAVRCSPPATAGQQTDPMSEQLVRYNVTGPNHEKPLFTLEQIANSEGDTGSYKLRLNDELLSAHQTVALQFYFDDLVRRTGIHLELEVTRDFEQVRRQQTAPDKLNWLRRGGGPR